MMMESGCGLGWLQFVDWLESSLDQWGLDAPLYSRCVLSILRQPTAPSPVSRESSIDADDLVAGWGRPAILVPPSAAKRPAVRSPVGDGRRVALIECLKSVEQEGMNVELFASEIVKRYLSMNDFEQNVAGSKMANDSVDSGVCPSPEDTNQNYDEAFPPLADDTDDLPPVRSLTECGTWPTGRSEPMPVPGCNTLLSPQDSLTPVVFASAPFCVSVGPLSWRMPRIPSAGSYSSSGARAVPTGSTKRRKVVSGEGGYTSVVPFTTEWTRQLHSCPDDMPFRPKVSKSPAPRFVIPKCAKATSKSSEKVGSCPMRLEFSYSGPPLFGDMKKVYPLKDSRSGEWPTAFTSHWSKDSSENNITGSGGSNESMFDAPRFILNVISEDKNEAALPISSRTAQIANSFTEWSTVSGDDGFCWSQAAGLFPGKPKPSEQDPSQEYDFCLPKGFDLLLPPTASKPEEPMRGTVAVSPSTHFLPIKSESLDEAYFPRPLMQCTKHNCPSECEKAICYAMGYYREEEYYVLRDHSGPGEARSIEIADVKRPSLPLKFKAELPEKEVQTEPESDCLRWCHDLVDTVWQPLSPQLHQKLSASWEASCGWSNALGSPSPPMSADWFRADVPCVYPELPIPVDNNSYLTSPVFMTDWMNDDESNADANAEARKAEEEEEADQLLRIVGSISLLSPLDTSNTIRNVEEECH